MSEVRYNGVSGGGAPTATSQESRAADALKAKNAVEKVEKMALTPVLNNAVKMINRTAQENQKKLKG